jgi:hypothetical protein
MCGDEVKEQFKLRFFDVFRAYPEEMAQRQTYQGQHRHGKSEVLVVGILHGCSEHISQHARADDGLARLGVVLAETQDALYIGKYE